MTSSTKPANPPTPVLITGMGSTTAISVAKALRGQSEVPVRIIGADINLEADIAGSSFCDRFHTVPKAIDTPFIPRLLEICRTEGVKVLFPIIDIELEVIAAHIDQFRAAGVTVWVSDITVVRTCNDKYETFKFFQQHKFPTAQSWLPDEFAGAQFAARFPLIVKPRDGVSSIDVFRVDSADELKSALQKIRRPIIQEFLRGTEYTIDVVAAAGQVLAVVPRERIEVKAGISTKGRTVHHARMEALAAEIAIALNLNGPCNIQCRIENDAPRFFEINPRFSGTLPLTVAAGVNSPLMLLKLALNPGSRPGKIDFREGVYMARYWEEIFRNAD